LGRTVKGLAEAGRLVIVATHDLAWTLHYADRLLVLHEGRLAADGAPETVLKDTPLWERVGLYVPPWLWETVP
jgi:ABC-type hemin transport system ATPase subunit